MRILNRHIGLTVISTILMVILALMSVEILIEFSREFSDVGIGNYGFLQAMLYVPMMLPQDVYKLFPMAGLMGSLIALGMLASHSELIVMRAAGVSVERITWAVIKAAIIMSVLAVIIGEFIAPFSQHAAIQYKASAMSGGQAYHSSHGIWVRNGNNFVHINSIKHRGHLQGITSYQFNAKHELKSASFAKNATYANGGWMLHNIAESNIVNDHVKTKNIPNQTWSFKFKPKLLGVTSIDPDQETLWKLYDFVKYRKLSGAVSPQYELAFWQRIFQPLATLVMIVLAVPFIFGPLRTVTMGLRILAGVMVGFAFYIFNQFIGPISIVYQFSTIIAAALPSILFAIFGGILIKRIR